jgi:glutamyl-tRNA synthetase
MKTRTRIAPSPTGEMHVGNLRTVLYDYALAEKYGGEFIVRIEDTDRTRFIPGLQASLLQTLRDYGLNWDEGPEVGGSYGPYVQSERLEIYHEYLHKLIQQGDAYYCFLNSEEVKELQIILRKEGKKLRSPYRTADKSIVKELLDSGKPYTVRLKVPEDEVIEFDDVILGKLKFNTNEIDDQILLKQDGFPTYHLGVVVDDYLMKITHVIRGNDWLPSTPKHVLLYRAFDWPLPNFAHVPNLKEKGSGKKLSKRHGAVFASQFLVMGYLPKAILNFLMLLGWSSPEERRHGEAEREIFSLEEFVQLFDLDRVHKTALVSFDREKLIWFNKQYIKSTDISELKNYFISWMEKNHSESNIYNFILSETNLESKLELVKERAITLVDMMNMLDMFYFAPIDFNVEKISGLDTDTILKAVEQLISIHLSFNADSSDWLHEQWEKEMRTLADRLSVKHGDVFMILRIAVCGQHTSPPLFEVLQIIGKDEVVKRIKKFSEFYRDK